MNKKEAIKLFGTSQTELAKALKVTDSAISQWGDELSLNQEQRVIGAYVMENRSGILSKRGKLSASKNLDSKK